MPHRRRLAAQTRNAEAAIRDLFIARGAQLYPREAPLALQVTFYDERRASAPRRVLTPTKRPDLDQFLKLILDGATGIIGSSRAAPLPDPAWRDPFANS